MEVDTPVAKPRTLVLHPLTQEVYHIPNRSLLHDSNHPVFMEYDAFEQMSATGQLSGERLLHHDRAQACSFNVSQIMAVRLRQRGASAGGRPIYAWASRMVTALPEDVFPELGNALVGQEFVWLWPPGKAYNAYQTRLDKRRRNPEQRALPIDEVEPTISHTVSVPGAMLGPDDIEGAVRVPPEELTREQRFFVMCIKPQQTLFPRRPLSDMWTQRVSAIVDQNQIAARQGGKWTLHNSVERLRKRRMEQNSINVAMALAREEAYEACGATEELSGWRNVDLDEAFPMVENDHADKNKNNNKRRRIVEENEDEEQEEQEDQEERHERHERHEPRGSPSRETRLFGSENKKPPPPPANGNDDGTSSDHFEQAVNATIARRRVSSRSVRNAVQAAYWADLPEELLARILCVRLGDALVSPNAADARDCILTLRRVSKGALNLVDSYVGAQIASLLTTTRACLSASQPASLCATMPAVAARVRALGLGMMDVMRLVEHRIELRPETSWALAKTPRTVPDWRWYLELRHEARARHGQKTIVNKPRLHSSKLYYALMERHRFVEPHVWGSRFGEGNPGFGINFDTMVAAAGEIDIRDQMHETAGIGA